MDQLPPLKAPELRGEVVLVHFWTYTCIKRMRMLPYVRAWSEKYAKDGLVLIRLRASEFSFEPDLANVRRHTRRLKVEYRAAFDNDQAIWRGVRNHFTSSIRRDRSATATSAVTRNNLSRSRERRTASVRCRARSNDRAMAILQSYANLYRAMAGGWGQDAEAGVPNSVPTVPRDR